MPKSGPGPLTRITIGYPDNVRLHQIPSPSVISTRPPTRSKIALMDWLIAHAFWVLGGAALLIGVLFSLHSALHSIRLRASVLACALVTASAVLWPARLWMVQHRPMGSADPAIQWIVTIALWLAIASVPLAILGRPRLAGPIVIVSIITFVFWYRTAVPREISLCSMLHISNPVNSGSEFANSPAKPSPAHSGSVSPTPVSTRPPGQ